MDRALVLNNVKTLTRGNLGIPLMLMALLGMMILPMPAFLLDVFFTFNITLSIVILLVCVYAMRPMEFASFPTVLLVATLYCSTAATEKEVPQTEQSGPMRGIYLDVNRGRNLDLVKGLIERGRPLGVNYVVVDVQPYASYRFLLNPEVIQYLKSKDVYSNIG